MLIYNEAMLKNANIWLRSCQVNKIVSEEFFKFISVVKAVFVTLSPLFKWATVKFDVIIFMGNRNFIACLGNFRVIKVIKSSAAKQTIGSKCNKWVSSNRKNDLWVCKESLMELFIGASVLLSGFNGCWLVLWLNFFLW